MPDERFQNGLRMRQAVLGEEYVRAALDDADEVSTPLQRLGHHAVALPAAAGPLEARVRTAAGNTVVWKPSEHTSMSALAVAQLFEEAGFPPGVVNVVTGSEMRWALRWSHVPTWPRVAFTGGDGTGQAVYETAARNVTPVTLELVASRRISSLRTRTWLTLSRVSWRASSRRAPDVSGWIAGPGAPGIYDEFVTELVDYTRSLRLGDSLDPTRTSDRWPPASSTPRSSSTSRALRPTVRPGGWAAAPRPILTWPTGCSSSRRCTST